MLVYNFLSYIASFLLIWLGAGLIVSSIDKFAHRLKLSSFAVSFVLLGLLTSTPEFAVGFAAISEANPEIFVGNLLGGIPVIFLFVIPMLAIFGNGVQLKHFFSQRNMLLTLGVIVAPSIMILDKKVTNAEGAFLIALYAILLFVLARDHGFLDRKNKELLQLKAYSLKDILKVLFGAIIVFGASQIIVDHTLYFSRIFSIHPLYISLIVLSLGTNLPELSLAIRSIMLGKKDVAFGDYMGSAAVNSLFFGIFTLINQGDVLTANRFPLTFVFIVGGIALFFIFSRSRNSISRLEGCVLLCLYIVFSFFELKK